MQLKARLFLKNRLKDVVALGLGLLVALMLGETFLRIYNPFEFRARGYSIGLVKGVQYKRINSGNIPGIDNEVVMTKNSLGFRGEEPPLDLGNYYKILIVGGSTSECISISDGKTWSDVLDSQIKERYENIWINNAGIMGHSTFAHLVLLRDHLLQLDPDMLIFYIGVNDMSKEVAGEMDQSVKDIGMLAGLVSLNSQTHTIVQFLSDKSELFNVGFNLYRYYQAYKKGLVRLDAGQIQQWPGIRDQRFLSAPVSDEQRRLILNVHLEKYIPGYRQRVQQMIRVSRENDITPVLVTQPILYGCTVDPSTGLDLSLVAVEDGIDGCTKYRVMELYNDVLRDISREEGVYLVDVVPEFPHDSRLYIDMVHYSNEGSRVLGEIIAENMLEYIGQQLHQ